MRTISSRGKWASFGSAAGMLLALFLGSASATVQTNGAGTAGPKSGPGSAGPDERSGNTLSGQLDRNKGVIHPPSTDPGMTIPVPPAGGNGTPIIPPPIGPGVQPK
jgi:hypothetical protein